MALRDLKLGVPVGVNRGDWVVVRVPRRGV